MPDNKKLTKYHIKEKLHVVRNPHGWVKEDVRKSTLDLCNLLEKHVYLLKLIESKFSDTYYPIRTCMVDKESTLGDKISELLEESK